MATSRVIDHQSLTIDAISRTAITAPARTEGWNTLVVKVKGTANVDLYTSDVDATKKKTVEPETEYIAAGPSHDHSTKMAGSETVLWATAASGTGPLEVAFS